MNIMNIGQVLAGVIEVLGAMSNDAELDAKIAELDAGVTEARAQYESDMADLAELKRVEKTRTDDEVRNDLS